MYSFKKLNLLVSILPLLIFSLGYVTHLSTSVERAKDHLLFFVISYALFFVVSTIDYHLYENVSVHIYKLAVALLILVFILGETRLGSSRWISLGIFTFQPSEFAKIAVVLFVAFFLNKDYNQLNDHKKLLKLLMYVAPAGILVLIQPDLGSAIILFSAFLGMLYVAGLNWLYFFLTFCVFGLLSSPLWHLLKTYQQHRILVFLNPELDLQGRGYNVVQSLIAIGSGGLWGKGFGHGTQSHLSFLPIYWTDFIFAAFAEEWGLIGVIFMLIFYLTLLLVLLYVLTKSKDRLGTVLTGGIFAIFFVQFSINIGMNMGLLPVTGIPLPFVSHGGTSMLVSFVLLGIANSVWAYRRV